MKSITPTKSPVLDKHCPKSPCGAHWWLIDTPAGADVEGQCRYCGTKRVFSNSMDTSFNTRESG